MIKNKTFPIKNNVRALREQKENMTQSDLGKKVGVTRQTVAAIEQQKYSPSLETAFRIALEFNVGIEEVFFWDE